VAPFHFRGCGAVDGIAVKGLAKVMSLAPQGASLAQSRTFKHQVNDVLELLTFRSTRNSSKRLYSSDSGGSGGASVAAAILCRRFKSDEPGRKAVVEWSAATLQQQFFPIINIPQSRDEKGAQVVVEGFSRPVSGSQLPAKGQHKL
jgi:hypothetical protein